MGADVKKLVPFGRSTSTTPAVIAPPLSVDFVPTPRPAEMLRGLHGDLGQTRGAQSGEADRHAVWLAGRGLELRLSPFDPLAVLDEIERLVPSYKLDRLNLFAGNDVHSEPGFVPVASLTAPTAAELILPAHDGLFTSGVLGEHTKALVELDNYQESIAQPLAEAAAD